MTEMPRIGDRAVGGADQALDRPGLDQAREDALAFRFEVELAADGREALTVGLGNRPKEGLDALLVRLGVIEHLLLEALAEGGQTELGEHRPKAIGQLLAVSCTRPAAGGHHQDRDREEGDENERYQHGEGIVAGDPGLTSEPLSRAL